MYFFFNLTLFGMCGRYSFSSNTKVLTAQFEGLEIGQNLEINFNIAPTQLAYVITDDTPGTLQQFRWGLIPFWAKDKKIASRMINARSETLLEKPAFRNAATKRHCWVLADSFYEWKKENGQKIPYRIQLQDESILVMAGLWETWVKGAEQVHSFTIITCAPNAEMAPIHNRMPLILDTKMAQQDWLEEKNPVAIQTMMQTPPGQLLKMYPVSPRVNAVRNNGPALHLPFEKQGDLFS
jgi:putative SOS response-associated peptidase YedK